MLPRSCRATSAATSSTYFHQFFSYFWLLFFLLILYLTITFPPTFLLPFFIFPLLSTLMSLFLYSSIFLFFFGSSCPHPIIINLLFFLPFYTYFSTRKWLLLSFFLSIFFIFVFFIFIFFHLVRTYVFHVLRTYVILLCNWLILWQNALYLYLGRSRMCLILQETCCSSLVLKPWRLDPETSKEKLFIKARQIAQHLRTNSSTAARHLRTDSSTVARRLLTLADK